MKIIVCKDLGSASIISESEKKKNCLFFLKNPAKEFFKKKVLIQKICSP